VSEGRPRREPLSHDRVIAAAIAQADAAGLAAVTIRGLARELGVEPMSLYHWTPSRDHLVAAMVDRIAAEFALAGEGDWRSAVRASAISAHAVLREHPWACAPLMSAGSPSPARLRHIDALLARLEDADLPAGLMDVAYHAIDSHILGFTLWEAGYASGILPSTPEAVAAFLDAIHIERYPHLQAHARWHLEPHEPGNADAFEFGLDLILDGAERLRPV
jgi:AcrR family transcriptional regulator